MNAGILSYLLHFFLEGDPSRLSTNMIRALQRRTEEDDLRIVDHGLHRQA